MHHTLLFVLFVLHTKTSLDGLVLYKNDGGGGERSTLQSSGGCRQLLRGRSRAKLSSGGTVSGRGKSSSSPWRLHWRSSLPYQGWIGSPVAPSDGQEVKSANHRGGSATGGGGKINPIVAVVRSDDEDEKAACCGIGLGRLPLLLPVRIIGDILDGALG